MKPLALLALALTACAASAADPVPPKVRSGAFVEMIAQRGVECGHLKQWQGLSLRALSLQDREGWPAEDVAALKAETARLASETACDAETLTLWIEGSRKGFDSEMLAPYLVAYKALAGMEAPPAVFTATALRLDKAPVVAAIDAKLEALAASGRPAEGGKPWPDYIDRTSTAVLEFAGSLEAEGGDRAAAWIAQSARIIEIWYEEERE
ncbi:MAG: hypothetical protein KDA53_04675 [Hyphomonas sp.]|nr:hypothetical protein [Hyphomonas sp.]